VTKTEVEKSETLKWSLIWTDETTKKTKSNYLRMCLFSFTMLEVEQVNLKVVRMVENRR